MTLLIRDARVVTPPSPGTQRGAAMAALRDLPAHDVLVEGSRIADVRPTGQTPAPGTEVVDAAGRVLLPGLVDCHTHANWAGDRYAEWERLLAGATYQEILAAGGGIHATVRAVRDASQNTLRDLLLERLDHMLRLGSTTVEVKSGYGLTREHELKMLRAAADAAARWPGTLVPTALLGHAIDPDRPDFVRATIDDTLPAVHAEFPGVAVDVFVERGAWSLDDARRLLSAARDLGHPVRLHADQFTSQGGVDLAIDLGAASVDHLEATTPDGAARLAASSVTGVVLPVCAMHLGRAGSAKAADARAIIDRGGAIALATNYNPGSAPCPSLPNAAALAVRLCGVLPAEAISACTVNAAGVLGLADRGCIAPGLRADLVLLRERDPRAFTFALGDDPVHAVVCAGRVVRPAT